MNHKATLVSHVLAGHAAEVWIQGTVLAQKSTGSFVIDDGSGAIECFNRSHSRKDIFSISGTPHIVLPKHSSRRLLQSINESFPPVCPVVTPPLGAYVVVWGGIICLIDPDLANIRMRLVVDKWEAIDNGAAKAEIHWLTSIHS